MNDRGQSLVEFALVKSSSNLGEKTITVLRSRGHARPTILGGKPPLLRPLSPIRDLLSRRRHPITPPFPQRGLWDSPAIPLMGPGPAANRAPMPYPVSPSDRVAAVGSLVTESEFVRRGNPLPSTPDPPTPHHPSTPTERVRLPSHHESWPPITTSRPRQTASLPGVPYDPDCPLP